ncbi:MAG: hypothetical protein ACI8S6_000679 [Myxococcota bacterium]
MLDEESYLAIATQLDFARPYDWWRPWPPWGGHHEADAFVYAHPPLHLWWVTALSHLSLPTSLLKRLSGLPWALLLGASGALIAQRTCRRPALAAWVWLTSPIVLLSLQRGLMPDLPVVAWSTAAVAGWLLGGRAAAVGGLCLGLAVWTKYPALVLVPVFALDGLARRRLQPRFWLCAAVLPLLGEAWLWSSYGRPHLWEVLSRADEIPRGPLPDRTLGLLVRAALLAPLPALLLGPAGLLLGLAALILAASILLTVGAPPTLLTLAATGALVIILSALAVRSGWRRQDPSFLLGLWVLAALSGVALGHNFAGARYLLPAALPAALLLVTRLESRRSGRIALWAGGGLWLAAALLLSWGEHRLASAQVTLADQAIARWPEGGQFQGEWTFRWRLESAGWRFYTGSPDGGVIVSAANASPGAPPPGQKIARMVEGGPGVIIVAPSHQIGLYGETLGAWPAGWGPGPVEEVTAWR